MSYAVFGVNLALRGEPTVMIVGFFAAAMMFVHACVCACVTSKRVRACVDTQKNGNVGNYDEN